MRYLEKMILLQRWMGCGKIHLLSMDHLKEGLVSEGTRSVILCRSIKRKPSPMFEALSQRMQEDVVEKLFTVQMPDKKTHSG
jgi:preprotein translocase subunit SecA